MHHARRIDPCSCGTDSGRVSVPPRPQALTRSWPRTRDRALAFQRDLVRSRAAAEVADDLGVGGLWMMDHLTGAVHERDHVLECFAVLGGLAHVTSRCRVGSFVVNCGVRNPALLAQSAATVHDQSAGRFVLGLGAGGGTGTPYAHELEVAGFQRVNGKTRRTRVLETIEVVEHLWSDRRTSWRGESFQVGSAQGFLHPAPAPRILLGGFGPKMATLAGERADAFNTHANHPDLEGLFNIARAAAARVEKPQLETTAFDTFDPKWLDPASAQRERLSAAGVDTLILVLAPPFDHEIIAAIAAS